MLLLFLSLISSGTTFAANTEVPVYRTFDPVVLDYSYSLKKDSEKSEIIFWIQTKESPSPKKIPIYLCSGGPKDKVKHFMSPDVKCMGFTNDLKEPLGYFNSDDANGKFDVAINDCYFTTPVGIPREKYPDFLEDCIADKNCAVYVTPSVEECESKDAYGGLFIGYVSH